MKGVLYYAGHKQTCWKVDRNHRPPFTKVTVRTLGKNKKEERETGYVHGNILVCTGNVYLLRNKETLRKFKMRNDEYGGLIGLYRWF